MAQANFVLVANGLTVAQVDSGVIHTKDPPPGGGSFIFAFNTIVASAPGVQAYRSAVAGFSPLLIGGTVRAALKRGLTAASAGFEPFLFIGLATDDVDDFAYCIGLEEAQPARVLLRRGLLSEGVLSFGRVRTGLAEPFVLADLQTLLVDVDGSGDQTITFNAAEFGNIALATAAEVVAEINTDLIGATATEDATTGEVIIESDGDASRLEVTGGTAAAALAFPSGLSGILAASTTTFDRDTWVHLRLDAIEETGAIELDAFRNDLDQNALNLPANWEAIPGMTQFVDPATDALVGGFAGYGFRNEGILRQFAFVDHVEIFRDV